MATNETITLTKTDDGWIATDVIRGVSSEPLDSREEALEDLDEVVALHEGELELSSETKDRVERSRQEVEQGDVTPLAEL